MGASLSSTVWRSLCFALEGIELERTRGGFLSRSLEQIERLVPFSHALGVLTTATASQRTFDEVEIRRVYEFPFSPGDGKLHTVRDATYGEWVILSRNAPAGFWDEYFSHRGGVGWTCSSIDPRLSARRLEVIDWLDFAGKDSTEIGCFVKKHDSRYVLGISNYADRSSPGFRFCLYRGRRTPFTEIEVATVSALFPHLRNLCSVATDAEADGKRRARAAAAAAGLTRREQEVAVLVSERLSVAEIAERLFISPRTVAKHVEHIHGKLRASGKREVRRRLLGND